MTGEKIGKYLTLEKFCTCTQTYRTYKDQINPFPANPQETIPAILALIEAIVDPVIDEFGCDRFRLTYGFCSKDLKRYLEKKDPVTGQKNGRVAPELDQHLAHEVNQKGHYYCHRLGASCDFLILDLSSSALVEWILAHQLPFDSLYFYGENRPIHISYGPQQKRDIWTFTRGRQPTKKGIEAWVELAKLIQ
jgi:hypothetical protein